MARIKHDPATTDHSTAKARLGELFDGPDGKVYCYVQFVEVDVVAIAVGTPVQWAGSTAGIVTADVSASAYGAAGPICGVAANDVSDDNYGYMQVRGFCTNVVTDGSVTDGMQLVSVSDGAADGLADISASLFPPFGIALADDVGAALTASYLYCT